MEKNWSFFFQEFHKGNFFSKAKSMYLIVHLLLSCTWCKKKKGSLPIVSGEHTVFQGAECQLKVEAHEHSPLGKSAKV